MKIIVSTLNSKFTHTSLAIRLISNWLSQHGHDSKWLEYTINSPIYPIVGELYKERAEVYIFSLYIWNGDLVKQIASDLKKLMPHAKIVFGGPEVSFDAQTTLENSPFVDYILRGEGELATQALMAALKENQSLEEVQGLTWRSSEGIKSNPLPAPVNMDEIQFPYPDVTEQKDRILYYESSRGCPYNCSYCLSSATKGIRFKSFERVVSDLEQFVDAGVRQVKWIDRTFNADPKRARAIWELLSRLDDGRINHHFEITAELLTDEDLSFLSQVRTGLFQFEIGVQTTMREASEAVNRRLSFEKLAKPVYELQKNRNIHVHLDLIAGLPHESYERFLKSFDDVYGLAPQVLQLGFLKLIKGSGLRKEQTRYGYISQSSAPYEVMASDAISFEEMLKLKDMEEVVEQLHNSKRFDLSLMYLLAQYERPSVAFTSFANWLRGSGAFEEAIKGERWYLLLSQFYLNTFKPTEAVRQLFLIALISDYMAATGKQIPDWMGALISLTDAKAEAFELAKTEIFNRRYTALSELSPKERIKKIRYAGIQSMKNSQIPATFEKKGVKLHKVKVALSESDGMIVVDLTSKHPVTERYGIDLFLKE